jgi:hypothetical protein
MSNAVWTWFKKLGHWIAVGAADGEKAVEALRQSGVLTLLGPLGSEIQLGIGVFEKILAGNTEVQVLSSTLGDGTLTGAQKLTMATPKAVGALLTYADAIGMTVPQDKATELQTISSGIASFGADFLNLLVPKGGDKLPTPPTPPAATTGPGATVAPKK